MDDVDVRIDESRVHGGAARVQHPGWPVASEEIALAADIHDRRAGDGHRAPGKHPPLRVHGDDDGVAHQQITGRGAIRPGRRFSFTRHVPLVRRALPDQHVFGWIRQHSTIVHVHTQAWLRRWERVAVLEAQRRTREILCLRENPARFAVRPHIGSHHSRMDMRRGADAEFQHGADRARNSHVFTHYRGSGGIADAARLAHMDVHDVRRPKSPRTGA